MKKNRKKLIIGGIAIVVLAVAVGIFLNFFSDENNLTLAERQWLNDNSGVVQTIQVINNINIFGDSGNGVFYDFIDDFSRTHDLTINPIIYNFKEGQPSGIAFKRDRSLGSNDLEFFRDHFVLVGKEEEVFVSSLDLINKKIGVLDNDLSYISSFLSNDVGLIPSDDEAGLMTAFEEGEEIDYILVPRTEFMDKILSKGYKIVYHLSDIAIYYSLQLDKEDATHFSSSLNKYYNTWINTRFNRSYDRANRAMFLEALEINQKSKDTLTSRVYNHGFIENNPYEVIRGGNYGGIVSAYLKSFSDFANVEFKFMRFKNNSVFNNAVSNKEIDLYFNMNASSSEFTTINTLLNVTFDIIALRENYVVVNSLKSLNGMRVYVLENSILESALKAMNLNVETYSEIRDIRRIRDDNAVIAIDSNIFEYYSNRELKNYTVRYTETINRTYNFRTSANETFIRLFSNYINSLDPNEMINRGINNHEMTMRRGNFITNLATYALYITGILLVVGFIIWRSMKKIKLSTKIKKEDKMRFIDQLTSLKNRNYLSENIENWNKNTVYPQAMIVMDLNNVQEINDTLGYDQGDAQIKAAANVLINTQLDNSDVIRTDGNEFLIYTIGYTEKRIVDYIRKIYKELKNMPFDYGAVIGYSMVLDDLKTAEDAINEAVEDMKNKKTEVYDEEI